MQVLSRLQTVNNSDGHISQGHAIATESRQGWISHTGLHFQDQDGNKPIQDGGEAKAPLWLNRLSGTD